MSRALHLTADADAHSMVTAIRRVAPVSSLLVITQRALRELAAELDGYEAALAELLAIAEEIGHPIAVNLPTGADTSSTAFVSPRGWTEERLQGWIGGHHAELEDAFGTAARVGPNRAERRQRRG